MSRTLSSKARRRLKAAPDFDDLLLLQELDAAGRLPGAVVATIEVALAYIREMAEHIG